MSTIETIGMFGSLLLASALLMAIPYAIYLFVSLWKKTPEVALSEMHANATKLMILSYLSVILPFLALPALFVVADFARWLADINVLAPYPPVSYIMKMSLLVPLTGLITGIISYIQVTHQPPFMKVKNRASVGITLSLFACGVNLFFAPIADKSVESAYNDVCRFHNKTLFSAIQMYAADYDDTLPEASSWCELVSPYIKDPGEKLEWVFLCPKARKLQCAYAYNDSLNRAKLSQITQPENLIALFESNAGWNAHGGKELLVKEPRHLRGDYYGFADGHVTWMSREKLSEYRWEQETTKP
jgi:hypothetical protein